MGDVFYEGCSKFTCVKKGKKLKWIESPASDRCCSYEGVLYPPGQEVARLTTSNNCSQVTSMTTITTTSLYINPQVILFCSSGPTMQVEVENLCQTTPGTNTNSCPLALERIEAMIEEAQTNIEAKVEEVQSNIGSRIEEVGNNIEAQIQEVCNTCATPAPVTEGLIVKV